METPSLAVVGTAVVAAAGNRRNSDGSSSESSNSFDRMRHQAAPRGPWTKKPLSIVLDEIGREGSHSTVRHLSVIDLIAIGVGGTIGSGVFVLTGYIANHYAGPGTFLSFAISGLAASVSGLCYAELAGRIPAAGSTYIYTYISLGEWAAVVAAACLTLEYGVSGAAVARSWGDKVVEWLSVQWKWENAGYYLFENSYFNPMAALVSTASTFLLYHGVQESKFVTNVSTFTKVGLVIVMIIGGLCLFDSENLSPMAPMGTSGVLRGATSSFFGYLGYDEVCCIAAEAKNPQRDLPRAVLWTLAIVTVFYIATSIALVGMLPYEQISDTSGFPSAFHDRGLKWLAQVTAAGEVMTLPVVVLIALMAQPRLQLAMANDGLLPEIFSRVDETGNLKWGCLLSGVPMITIAAFVPFTYLDDLISVGILVAFCMTNTSLILLRCENPLVKPHVLHTSLGAYHILCFISGLLCHWDFERGASIRRLCLLAVLILAIWIHKNFPPTGTFGGLAVRRHGSDVDFRGQSRDSNIFLAPFVPMLPCVGIFINWYLISQLELSGMLLLILYIGAVSLLYIGYCKTSFSRSWQHDGYGSLSNAEEYLDRDMVLLRELSLPKRSSQATDA